MKNLLAATQTAVFRALKTLESDADLLAATGGKMKVYTHVPENVKPPFLKIGQLSSANEAEGYDQVERVTVEVIAIWRGAGNSGLLAMIHSAQAVLDGQEGLSEDAQIQPPYMLNKEVSEAAADGETYVGVINFEMLVEPAE